MASQPSRVEERGCLRCEPSPVVTAPAPRARSPERSKRGIPGGLPGGPSIPFTLDRFQLDAIAALDRGRSVIVVAPTGAGKTVVADHAIDRALRAGGKAFSTTPLKALCNQKYRDLRARLGDDRVGLLTGDTAVNVEAAVVVMTTEVARALLYEQAPLADGLAVIVLDEFHYLQDPERGPVWEEVVVHAPRHAQLVCLSATIADPPRLGAWLTDAHGPTDVIVEEQRPVPLVHLYAIGNLVKAPPLLLPIFVDGAVNSVVELQDGVRRDTRGEGLRVRDRARRVTPERADLLDMLRRENLLPALWFILSRGGCERAVAQLVDQGVRLTTPTEGMRLREVADDALGRLDPADARALDADHWRLALECGLATHHGGLAPVQREAVELAFADGLAKVVFATETLALGLNLPARTVVIDRVTRPDGQGRELISTGEFAQLAGRAGRRGLDPVGQVVIPWAADVDVHRVAGLAAGRIEPLVSHLVPTPSMAANLVALVAGGRATSVDAPLRHTLAHHLATDLAAALGVELAARRTGLEAAELHGIEKVAPLEVTGNEHEAGIAAALSGLRPGDVIVDPVRPALTTAAVVAMPRLKRGRPVVDTVRPTARRVVVTVADFRQPPVVVGQVIVTGPVVGARGEARAVADQLTALPRLQPLAFDSQNMSESDMFWLSKRGGRVDVAALAEQIAVLEARVDDLEHGLGDHLHAVLGLLRDRGHLDAGGALTTRGRLVRRVFHPQGLLVAEALGAGLFDGLDPPETAALAACFRAGRRIDGAVGILPTAALRDRWPAVIALARDVQRAEERRHLPATAFPDQATAAAVHRYTAGESLANALGRTGLRPGDLVRELKQVAELLDQMAAGATDRVADACREAATAMARGVAVASVYEERAYDQV